MNTFSDTVIRSRKVAGFSLVEVTLAIGIVSFCLLSLVGLLPTGLSVLKNSREQAAAGNTMSFISAAIRKASPDSSGTNFSALGSYSNSLRWSLGGAKQDTGLSGLSFCGTQATNAFDQRLVASVTIAPPASASTAGTARISVAWPATATWDTAAAKWKNAQGSVSTWVFFLPGQ